MSQEPLDFVQEQAWEYQLNGSQIEIKVCPFCFADDYKFYMNASTGLWDCKHQNRHNGKNVCGNIFQLKKALNLTLDVEPKNVPLTPLDASYAIKVAKAHQRLLDAPHDKQVLMDSWGISAETIDKFKLGITYGGENYKTAYIAIPHYKNGELYNIKYRSWFGEKKTFHRVKGAASVLLNEDFLTSDNPPLAVILAEGEKDAIAAYSQGITNIVGMTGGAGTLTDRWYDLLERVETIYVAYDGDNAGKSGTAKVISRLGEHKIKVVQLPIGYDIADYLLEFGVDKFKELLAKSDVSVSSAISTVSSVLFDLVKGGEKVEHFSTPWSGVDHILGGGMQTHHMYTVVAPPKIGKTSFTLEWALHEAINHGPSLYWCVEMSMDKLARYYTSINYGVSRKASLAMNYISACQFKDIPMYLGYSAQTDIKLLMETFKNAYLRLGITFFVFDNVHFAVRSEKDSSSKVLAMDSFVKACKTLTLEYPIRMILIAQPTKSNMSRGANLDYTNIGWSGAFASDSDAIIALHREKIIDTDESYKPEMLVKLDAGRETSGGSTFLRLENGTLKFRQLSRAETKALLNSSSSAPKEIKERYQK